MTAIYAALITAVAAALVAGIGYLLGYRRIRYERLYEQRAEVLAELSRLLWRFQVTALVATKPNQPPQVRAQRIEENQKALDDLHNHFFGHTVWLTPEVREIVEGFILDMATTLRDYEHDLNQQGQPRSDVGLRASKHIFDAVPLVRHDLDAAFREILYPPPLYEKPLLLLEWVDSKLKSDKPA